ncbi:chitin synthase-domain-containing protein [Chlamydoabsidia padenii]|nr:chitin synthase-domain-containing protein [Chlamydoabsidia padenii]
MKGHHHSRMQVPSFRRIVWVTLSRLCTILLPDFLLHYVFNLNSKDVRQAWREKITLLVIFLSCGAFFCFWLEYLSTLFCDQNKYYSSSSVFSNNSHQAALRNNAIDWRGSSSEMAKQVMQYLGHDVSPMFPTFMGLLRNTTLDADPPYDDAIYQRCIGDFGMAPMADQWVDYKLKNDHGYLYNNNQLVSCPYPNQTNVTGAPCYYSLQEVIEEKALGTKGNIVYDPQDIRKNYTTLSTATTPGKGYVILDNTVLDVTHYLESATNIVLVANGIHSRAFAIDRMFLPLDLTTILYLKLGHDITPYFDEGNVTSNPTAYRQCLQDLFKVGITPDGKVEECLHINPALWATMGCGLLYFLVKMNLANLSRIKWVQRSLFKSSPEFSMTMTGGAKHCRNWPFTLLLIPCYAENADTIRDTLDSLARTNYEDSRKMLVFVCDGLVQSAQDVKETWVCVLEALGCSTAQTPTPHAYVSLGQQRRKINYAKVYSGFYETGRNRVPFMVIVKVGASGEISVGRARGNRGKRDSMLMILGFLERCTHLSTNRMTPLEYELFNQCYNVLGIDPRRFKYMLVTDADTQVQNDVVHKLVARLERDRNMLAVSGHVRPANPEQNLITMLQIFPLYMTFFTGLAYEACLGNVLTINGGLVMYKIWTEHVPEDARMRQQQRISKSQSTSQESMQSKWPKVSDEIEFNDDNDDDPFATLPKDTTIMQPTWYSSSSVGRPSMTTTNRESQLSLSPNTSTRSCCIHPTVLRNFATPQPDTLHMKNVLLLGEDQYFGTVLLRSHPHHHLGFEPDAVGYATIPTNYWALQALQSRNLRATFHNQVEMTRAAKHIGFAAWFLSFTKILDMIFSMPIIVYLYGIFIRCFMAKGLAYYIIAISFGALYLLHIVYFLIRRQFKYVIWFSLYCLLSVPLFAIWFPLVAAWCSDHAEGWYDVWPTAGGWRWRDRLHGCVDDDYSRRVEQDYFKKRNKTAQENDENKVDTMDSVIRLQLGEFETMEAQRAYERATEEAAALDAKFTGFTAFGQSQSLTPPPLDDSGGIPSPPPLAQIKDDYASFRGTTSGYRPVVASIVDMYGGTLRAKRSIDGGGDMDNNTDLLPRTTTTTRLVRPHSTDNSSVTTNPFADTYDNPFDDGNAVNTNESPLYPMGQVQHYKHHKPSHSQSSYFSHLSSHSYDYGPGMFVPMEEAAAATTGGHHYRSYSAESTSAMDDRYSITSRASITNSCLSFDPETSLESRDIQDDDDGRSAAIHGRVGLKIPERSAAYRHHLRRLPSAHQQSSSDTTASFVELIQMEIRSYLSRADLDSTTRAQVKDHLAMVLGDRVRMDTLQDTINHCIEATTLELLAQQQQQ